MKTNLSLVILLLFFTYSVMGQARIDFSNFQLATESEVAIVQFLTSKYPEIRRNNVSLKLNFTKTALATTHYTFETNYLNVPVMNSCVKVSTDGHGRIIATSFESSALSRIDETKAMQALKEWNNVDLSNWVQEHVARNEPIKQYTLKWDFLRDEPTLMVEVKTWSKSQDQTFYFDSKGELNYYYDHARYANKKDTLISARVFKPDPLTRLGLTYGGSIADNADADQAWLVNAYDTVQILATWDSSAFLFLLENKWAVIDEFESPIVNPVTSLNSNFFYNRGQSGFEDCNALYHITNFQEYIQSLGYDTLMDLQLQVETHGQFGADNSVFMRNGGSPTVNFGTGGVDDAEDADVIVHEYCHGISWSANNNDNFTNERSGLDEGLADYFATSYSRVMNPFNWQNVFNWDGPIWGGRTANTSANYPSTGNIYAVGEIWNSAMSNIWNDLGPIITDKLMLETLHFFTNSTTLPEAAQYMLKADTLLFGGIHFYQLCANFSNKGILQGGCAPASSVEASWSRNVKIHKSLEFAKNESDLIIEFPEEANGNLMLYSVDGKSVKQIEWKNRQQVILPRAQISAGSYFLKVNTDKGFLNVQIAKWAE